MTMTVVMAPNESPEGGRFVGFLVAVVAALIVSFASSAGPAGSAPESEAPSVASSPVEAAPAAKSSVSFEALSALFRTEAPAPVLASKGMLRVPLELNTSAAAKRLAPHLNNSKSGWLERALRSKRFPVK